MRLSGFKLRRIAFALLLAGVTLLFYNRYREVEEQGDLRWFDRPVILVMTPLAKGVLFTRAKIRSVFDRYIFLVGVEKENEDLKKQREELKTEHLLWHEVQVENERLRKIVELKPQLSGEWVGARVVSYPPLGPYRLLTIDKGSEDGIQRRAPVISPDGLVGQVARVMKGYSQVLLIIDPTSAVDARIRGTEARGLIVGKVLKLELERDLFIGTFEYLNRSTVIEKGMEVTTSGLDGIYPPGIHIGSVISKKKKKYDVFQQADVLPAVDFYELKEVLIFKKNE